MTIENRTTVKTYFQTGDKPSQDQFENFIDSAIFYEDTSNFGRQLVSASSATSARNLLGVGTVGNNLFTATTTASAQNELGGKTVGKILFETNTTASAQTKIGGGIVGRQIFEATTTASATNIIFQPATSTIQGINYLSLPTKPITVANNSSTPNTDIDFTAGTMTFNDGSGQALSTAMTKRLQSTGSWSAGNNGNLLLSGARANSSTYHLFALYKTDGTVDYGALLGVAGTDPNPTSVLPSGYTKYEYIAPIITDGSGNIRAGIFKFRKDGSVNFKYNNDSAIPDINGTTLTTASRTLYTMALIPLGIEVEGFFEGVVRSSATIESVYVVATSPNQTDKPIGNTASFLVSTGASNAVSGGGQFSCLTSKSGQIGLKGDKARIVYVNVLGFEFYKI